MRGSTPTVPTWQSCREGQSAPLAAREGFLGRVLRARGGGQKPRFTTKSSYIIACSHRTSGPAGSATHATWPCVNLEVSAWARECAAVGWVGRAGGRALCCASSGVHAGHGRGAGTHPAVLRQCMCATVCGCVCVLQKVDVHACSRRGSGAAARARGERSCGKLRTAVWITSGFWGPLFGIYPPPPQNITSGGHPRIVLRT